MSDLCYGWFACRYAARLLLPKCPDLMLVEASAALGGRIKQVVSEMSMRCGAGASASNSRIPAMLL